MSARRSSIHACDNPVRLQDTSSLNEAQEKKLDLICRKLRLAAGDRVLDLGCGKGGFAKFAASRYGCRVTGVNLSGEEAA